MRTTTCFRRLAMAFLFILSCLAVAQAQNGLWSDAANRDANWNTAGTSLVIGTAEELAQMAWLSSNSGYTFADTTITLTADIDLAAHYWKPIDDFAGTFDGGSHTIRGLVVDEARTSLAANGFFAYLRDKAHIRNLIIEAPKITGSNVLNSYSGALAGRISHSSSGGVVTITNCHITAGGGNGFVKTPDGNANYFGGYIGGMIGACNNIILTISDCSNAVAVTAGARSGGSNDICIGGLIGYLDSSTTLMTRCSNSGAVTGTDTNRISSTGGLIGFIHFAYTTTLFTISLCSNSGAIKGGIVTGVNDDSNTGGLVGYTNFRGTIEYCLVHAPSITGGAASGHHRVLGGIGSTIVTLRGNYAFTGITGKTSWGNSASGYDGADFDPANPAGFSGGTGSDSDPYRVAVRKDMDWLSLTTAAGVNYSGKHLALVPTAGNTLDMGGKHFEPIGNFLNPGGSVSFNGTFDGRNNVIKGLVINKAVYYGTGCRSAALFGYLAGTVQNLILDAPQITGPDDQSPCYAGAIAGYAPQWVNASISNCHVMAGAGGGFVQGGTSDNEYYTGGIAGWFEGGSISGCHNSVDVTGGAGSSSCTGGISGSGYAVSNCYNAGLIKGDGSNDSSTGGIAGRTYQGLTNCFNSGTVEGGSYTGGIAGEFIGANQLANCLAIGASVAGTGADIHRITGLNNQGILTDNYAYAGMTGATWDNTSVADGADWSGLMRQEPIGGWDPAIWDIDPANRRMPKLQGVDGQPDIPNPVHFSMAFEANGGTPVNTLHHIYGDSVPPTAPVSTLTGHVFDGWYADAALTILWTFGTDAVTSDTTLYAAWIAEYKVVLDFGYGNRTDTLYNVLHDSVLVAPPTPARPGHIFDGWHADAALTTLWAFGTDTVKSDTTLYAAWTAFTPVPEYVNVCIDLELIDPDIRDHIGLNPIEGCTEVEKGMPFELRVWLNQHTDLSALRVVVNGKDVTHSRTEQQSSPLRSTAWTSKTVYVCSLVAEEDLMVEISGIRWNTGNPTGIAPQPPKGETRVYTAPGQIIIEGLTGPARVHIYNISGQLIFSSPQGGGRVEAAVAPGVYIVRIGSEAYKVRVDN